MPIQLGDIKLYNLKELTDKLDVTIVTLRNYINEGKLKGRKMGGKWFVTEDSLKEYFNSSGDRKN
jgi:predicted site-specific integrase-resolvase